MLLLSSPPIEAPDEMFFPDLIGRSARIILTALSCSRANWHDPEAGEPIAVGLLDYQLVEILEDDVDRWYVRQLPHTFLDGVFYYSPAFFPSDLDTPTLYNSGYVPKNEILAVSVFDPATDRLTNFME